MSMDDGGEPTRMRVGRIGFGGVVASMVAGVLLFVGPVTAHEDLVGSEPQADAVLATAPDEVSLTFTGELTPDGSSFEVTDATGQTVGTGTLDLEVAERNVLRGAVAISEPGRFEVHWTITGLDGHPITGELGFTVGGAPNTAAPAPAGRSMIGMVTLLVAAALVSRQALAKEPS